MNGIHWKSAQFWTDKNSNIYISSNYGIFKYNDKENSWIQEPANFDWRKIKRPSTLIKRQRGEGTSPTEIEVSDSIIYKCTENWFKDSLRFKKINLVTEQESIIAVDVSTLPELRKSQLSNMSNRYSKYYNKILDFDGKRIWFILYNLEDAEGGGPRRRRLRYLDITNDSVGFISKNKFPSCDFGVRVSRVVSDSKYIWIGTGIYLERGMLDNLGLFRLDYDLCDMVNYSKENNTLPSNGILDLLEYKDILWVATTKGIAKHNLKTEQWEYYNILEYITVDKDEKIEYIPCGEVVAESVKMHTKVRYLGTAYGGCGVNHIVKLQKEQEGWIKANEYTEKPQKVPASCVYLSPDENSKRVAPKNYSFYGIYSYPVVREKVKGWYKVIIDKGVIPGNSARFTLVKINLQE